MSVVTENIYLHFLIGVLAFFPSILPSLMVIMEDPEKNEHVKLQEKIIWMPLAYGIMSIVVFYLILKYVPQEYHNWWVVGIIFGLVFPTLGTVSGYAKKTYDIKSTPQLYISAQIMYIIFFGVIINFLVNGIQN